METIRTEQLLKTFNGVLRLGPLDLRLGPGEVLGVIGPYGSGKATLLKLFWGFMKPDHGRIFVFGMQPHLNQMSVRRRAGYLSENPQFYSVLTAKQFLRFVGNFYHGWEESYACGLLERCGVDPDLKVEKLSKGDRVKLRIASASGHHPSLLILDEPTSGLDSQIRLEVLGLLNRLAHEQNVSIVLSSHISNDLDHIADSILILENGRVVEYARTSRIDTPEKCR